MTTTQTTTPSASSFVLAGAAAEGHGALAGWRGCGGLTRGAILKALDAAGLPAEWAPASKRDVGHAGAILSRVGSGLIARRADAAKWQRSEGGVKTRAYRARWVIARNRADAVDGLGATLGDVVLIAELWDNSDELHIDATAGARGLASSILADYRAARDAELYDASDVTDWLRSTLIGQCGAARFSTGLYIPRDGRATAERLVAAIADSWGVDWINPLLPVATSEQLAVGLARGLDQDVAAVETDLASERAAARERRKSDSADVSPTVAARLLKSCADLAARLDQFAPLCGEHLAPVRERLRALDAELQPLVGRDVQRFALLELDGPAPERMPTRRAPASVAADRALERRRAERAATADDPSHPDWIPPGLRLSREEYHRQLDALDNAPTSTPAGVRDVLLASHLDARSDAARLVREIVAQLDDGRATPEQVIPRLEAMVERSPRWRPAALEVLSVLGVDRAEIAA